MAERNHTRISGLATAPESIAPSGMPMMPGWSLDSKKTGEPHRAQKHREPLLVWYFVISASARVIENSSVSAVDHAAPDVPENFLHDLQ